MTLRGRLTGAFLAVVLGPVLFGALFVSATVTAASHERSAGRLDLAATAVRTSVSALCQQLNAAADAVAVLSDPVEQASVASHLVDRGLATSILATDAAGGAILQIRDAPAHPWAECGNSPDEGGPPAHAIGVRLEVRDVHGRVASIIWAVQALDISFAARLAAATGTGVTLLGAGTGGYSTEPPEVRAAIIAAVQERNGGTTIEIDADRYVRLIEPSQGQPLPLALSAPREQPQGWYALLTATILLAGLGAVLAAWRLARSTTRPLVELASAADRVASGDLAARVPVLSHDEVGRLASTFNRMTRETQAYVQALTASRDQLRGHLAILGDTLSSTHDLQRILQVILQTAVPATGARAGAVLLLDQATGMLTGQYTEGTELPAAPGDDDRPAVTWQVPLSSGLLGTVAASGEPRRGRIDRDGPALSPYEPPCHTYLVVPFSARGSDRDTVPPELERPGSVVWPTSLPPTLGVLAVYDRLGSEEFEDHDLVTLRTFASQVAVAVDNVWVHEEAQRLSVTDPLTGLWNYRYLKDTLRREIERASRFGHHLAVLALDLDRFKEVNDRYGHAAGDSVLIEFARRVRAEVREVDSAFRQGGEEFVVLLPETDVRGGAIVAERLGAAIRDTPIVVEPTSDAAAGSARSVISVTVSIGVAVYPDHVATGQRLLDAADDALYAAKTAGRDTYRMAAAGGPPIVEELPVPASAATPGDDLPRAGNSPAGGAADPSGDIPGGRPTGGFGASFGPHPPRQSRGR